MLTKHTLVTSEVVLAELRDVLALRHFPPQHWKKIWSTNLLERVNEEINRRSRFQKSFVHFFPICLLHVSFKFFTYTV